MLALLALVVQIAAAPPPAPPPPPDCHDAAHRAYDFFVGDWEVTDTKSGRHVAHSRIEKVMGGCAIKETFDQDVGPTGKPTDYHGTSYTALSARDGQWHQFYVDTIGAAAPYAGGIEGGAMVLTATMGRLTNRMTVAPQPDGTVQQSGVISLDGGTTWSAPGYVFTYRHVTAGN